VYPHQLGESIPLQGVNVCLISDPCMPSLEPDAVGPNALEPDAMELDTDAVVPDAGPEVLTFDL
jgi:hypothetical protein